MFRPVDARKNFVNSDPRHSQVASIVFNDGTGRVLFGRGFNLSERYESRPLIRIDGRGAGRQFTMGQLHTPAEAAEILTIRESWLRTKAARRAIPCTFIGKHLRFSDDDIAKIMAEGERPPATARKRGARQLTGNHGRAGHQAHHREQHPSAQRRRMGAALLE